MTLIQKYIRKLDVYGKKVELRLRGKKSHKTVLGGIVAILNGLILSFIAYYYVQKFLNKSDPMVDIVQTMNSS